MQVFPLFTRLLRLLCCRHAGHPDGNVHRQHGCDEASAKDLSCLSSRAVGAIPPLPPQGCAADTHAHLLWPTMHAAALITTDSLSTSINDVSDLPGRLVVTWEVRPHRQ